MNSINLCNENLRGEILSQLVIAMALAANKPFVGIATPENLAHAQFFNKWLKAWRLKFMRLGAGNTKIKQEKFFESKGIDFGNLFGKDDEMLCLEKMIPAEPSESPKQALEEIRLFKIALNHAVIVLRGKLEFFTLKSPPSLPLKDRPTIQPNAPAL